MERAYHLIIKRVKRARSERSKSRNTRVISKAMREKYGIKISNTIRKTLILDRINRDNKWYNVIQKELIALEKLNV